DGANWRAFAAPLVGEFEALRATMLAGFPPVGGALKLLTGLGPLGTLRFAGLLPGSAQGLGKKLFSSPDARAWLYGAATHGDVPPTGAGSAVAAAYLNLMGHAVGWPSPEGGAGRLTDALASYFTSLGGEIRTGARVGQICASSRRVTGVELVGRERLGADVVV